MNRSFIEKAADYVAFGLFLIACVPLLVLSFHNHPSAADDYCFADTATRFGFWQAQKFYYDGWTGRYFSNFLVHGNPLVLGWYDGFRFIPALMTLGWIGGAYALVRELLRGEPVRTSLVVTATLFFLFILALQSTVEAFFWTAAVASYTVPTALTFYLLAVMLRWYRLPAGTLKTLTAVWAGVLIFAVVGSSETNLVLLVLLLGALLAYRLLFQRKIDWFLLGLVAVAVASSYLLLRAPGNAIRIGGNKMGGNFGFSFISAFGFLANLVLTWLATTPVLPLSVLFLPLAFRLVRPQSPTRPLFAVPIWVVGLLYVGLLAGMVFPSYFGVGIPPVFRVTNVVYAFFLVGWFYTLTVIVNRVVGRWPSAGAFRLPAWVLLVAGLWVGAGLWFSTSLRGMYTDWWQGDAARYDVAMSKRHRELLRTDDTLRVSPVGVYPPTLFLEDVRDNPDFLWNQCQARFYGHKYVVLDPTAN
ncbi:MAG: hypothetical protein H7Z72_22550 [Bacteroidetes bacterium]|nr:hypothetical protein [Fibrella sp.]